MFYERKGDAIITSAIDSLHDRISLFITEDGMLTDDEYTYGETFIHGVEDCWDDKIISDIVCRFGCKLQDKQIVRMIIGDNIDGAIVSMIQAATAVETYLYHMQNKTEG